MKTSLSHLEVRIDPANTAFYRELLAFLGWDPLHESEGILGMGCEASASLWFTPQTRAVANDYDAPGVNHIAIGAASQADVDAAAAYLDRQGVATLFETPRHRPEFAGSPDQTYYQVMFESPDRVLFEVVYTGPKS